MYNESYLHVLTTLRIHSLRRKKYCFMYELPLKTSQKPDAKDWKKGISRMLGYFMLHVQLGLLE